MSFISLHASERHDPRDTRALATTAAAAAAEEDASDGPRRSRRARSQPERWQPLPLSDSKYKTQEDHDRAPQVAAAAAAAQAAAARAPLDALRKYRVEAGLGERKALVFAGAGLDAADSMQARALVSSFVPGPSDPTWQERAHIHLGFDTIKRSGAGEEGLQLLKLVYAWLKERSWLQHWRVPNLEVVLRLNNESPDHQDKRTGALAYQRPPPAPEVPGGLRLLLDLGGLQTGEARCMRFTLNNGAVQLELWDALVAMDEAAAGSGRLGRLLHGRYGADNEVSATVSIDLALPNLTKQLGQGLPTNPCIKFFDYKDPHGIASRVHGRRGSRYGDSKPAYAAGAAARAEAAAVELGLSPQGQQAQQEAGEAGEVQEPRQHCYVCLTLAANPAPRYQTGRSPYWVCHVIDGARRRLCTTCDRQARDALPPRQPLAVQFCGSGCAGCTPSEERMAA